MSKKQEVPYCPICNDKCKMYANFAFAKTCGKRKCIQEAKEQTNLERYGHISNLHGEEGKSKVQATLKEKYGEHITNISQIPEVKEQKRLTCKENFGVDWPMQSQKIRDKSKETCLEKYGVDNVRKSPEIIQQMLETKNKIIPELGMSKFTHSMLLYRNKLEERTGYKHYFQTEEFKEKYRKTSLERFGVDNVRKSEYYKALMVERGYRLSYEELKNIERYRKNVFVYTRKTFTKYKELLENESGFIKFNNSGISLDHIFSVKEGFLQGIDPKIIGSIVNLQLLPLRDNIVKGQKSWIKLDELLTRFNDLDDEDRYDLFLNNLN